MIGNNIFAASSYEGVFLSTNNGGNWIQVNNGLTDLHVFALAVYGSNIFAGTGGGVFASSNNGATWSSMNAGLTNSSIASLAIHDNNFFAGTNGSGVFVSPVLTIANFTPVNGAANDVITITGTGFSATPSNNVVKFNGILTAALTATPTTLRVPVPNGAGSGPITLQSMAKRQPALQFLASRRQSFR